MSSGAAWLQAAFEKPFVVQDLPGLDRLSAGATGISCQVLREDLRHEGLSGNKWVKLLPHLFRIQGLGVSEIASCGGAYSNHLHALGWLGAHLGCSVRAIVRGERPESLNPTLQDLTAFGAQLHFVSRTDYRKLRQAPILARRWVGNAYWIPEGGADALGLAGVRSFGMRLLRDLPVYDYIILGCGSGTTLAGLASVMPRQTQVLGVCAFKGGHYLRDQIKRWVASGSERPLASWRLLTDYHFGGFAKMDIRLRAFQVFLAQWLGGIGLASLKFEPVYTLKAFYALCDLLASGYFVDGSRILFIHTGGMQGARGF